MNQVQRNPDYFQLNQILYNISAYPHSVSLDDLEYLISNIPLTGDKKGFDLTVIRKNRSNKVSGYSPGVGNIEIEQSNNETKSSKIAVGKFVLEHIPGTIRIRIGQEYSKENSRFIYYDEDKIEIGRYNISNFDIRIPFVKIFTYQSAKHEIQRTVYRI